MGFIIFIGIIVFIFWFASQFHDENDNEKSIKISPKNQITKTSVKTPKRKPDVLGKYLYLSEGFPDDMPEGVKAKTIDFILKNKDDIHRRLMTILPKNFFYKFYYSDYKKWNISNQKLELRTNLIEPTYFDDLGYFKKEQEAQIDTKFFDIIEKSEGMLQNYLMSFFTVKDLKSRFNACGKSKLDMIIKLGKESNFADLFETSGYNDYIFVKKNQNYYDIFDDVDDFLEKRAMNIQIMIDTINSKNYSYDRFYTNPSIEELTVINVLIAKPDTKR